MAPGSRHTSTAATVKGNAVNPRARLIRAMALNASNPASAPICVPLSAFKNRRTLAMRSSTVNSGAFSVFAASSGAYTTRPRASSPPDTMATAQPSAMIRPARWGSRLRNSATYLVAVTPSPRPAKTPSIPTVLWIIPYLPNCSRSNNLAVMTDAARLQPCEMTAPMRDQAAPLANRPRRESAAHTSRIAA